MFHFYGFDNRTLKRWTSLGEECQRRLTRQEIAPGNPGTILKDVVALLEFVGPKGIVTKSRNASLPAERLPELNAKISHPIKLNLKRALLRDYPNLAGLFILLRVMELVQMEGNRLVLGLPALECWRRLNPTEQYFALLEALLFQAETAVLGGGRTREEGQPFETVTPVLSQLSERWRKFDLYESGGDFGPQGRIPPWNMFAQQQLGLIELRESTLSEKERGTWGGRGWLVGRARLTPWGTAVTWALQQHWRKLYEDEPEESDKAAAGVSEPQLEFGEGRVPPKAESPPEPSEASGAAKPEETEFEGNEEPDGSEPEPGFGTLQPVFQPYFPEWQRVYALPKSEARTGTHIFKVSMTGWRGDSSVWRRLALPPDNSLDALAGAILEAFKFDEDHMYDFRYRDQRGRNRVYNHPYCDEGPWTPEITIGETELALKDAMLFTFDYGDQWEFKVRLEKVETGTSHLAQPEVIESAGKAPDQYPQAE